MRLFAENSYTGTQTPGKVGLAVYCPSYLGPRCFSRVHVARDRLEWTLTLYRLSTDSRVLLVSKLIMNIERCLVSIVRPTV